MAPRTMTEEKRMALGAVSDAVAAQKAQRGDDDGAPHPRAMAAKAERRRRTGMGLDARRKLSIPSHLEKDPNYRYYWLADRPGRVEQLTIHDDYDFVEDEETAADGRNTGLGKRIERHAGTDKFGNPVRHFLVRKPMEYYREDQREKRQAREKTMAAIKHGKTAGPDGQPILDDKMYVPEGGIKIQHGAGFQP
jgi:hypothetical protein